jgi:hypothetical protein
MIWDKAESIPPAGAAMLRPYHAVLGR